VIPLALPRRSSGVRKSLSGIFVARCGAAAVSDEFASEDEQLVEAEQLSFS
jgi:hypothetical protein